MGTHQPLGSDVKATDLIAFKVFTPEFTASGYVIGMVDHVERRNSNNADDFDLSLSILGKISPLDGTEEPP